MLSAATIAHHFPPPTSQAAYVSAIACTVGAAIPLLAGAFVADANIRVPVVAGATAAGCLVRRAMRGVEGAEEGGRRGIRVAGVAGSAGCLVRS